MIEVLKGRVCMYIFWDFGYVCGECHDNEVEVDGGMIGRYLFYSDIWASTSTSVL